MKRTTLLFKKALLIGMIGSFQYLYGQTTLTPTADTDTQSDVAAGTNTVINSSKWNNLYIRFDMSGITGSVTNAKIRIYKNSTTVGNFVVSSTSTDSWSEGGTKPNKGTQIKTVAMTSGAGYKEIDMTSTVQSKMSGNKILSVCINTDVDGWTQFNSRQNASNKPQLVITTGSTGDTQAPTTPTNLTSSSVGQNNVSLTWSASTDNVGVTGYNVYRNGTFVATATSTSYNVTGLSCNTSYSFYVRARDAAGNLSANSTTISRTTSACSSTGGSMVLGTNFWNPYWGNGPSEYFVTGTNFSTTTNPWRADFLNDIRIYKVLRFMDFGRTNNSNITTWSQRTPKTANQFDGALCVGGFAYEWMIDLCNRNNSDMWVCLPHKADANYWTQLATLIKNNLNSNLKVYVEYSNETWNGTFTQFQYTIDQGKALNLPGSNDYYKGGAFSVLQSLKIFKAFQDVFGVSAMGTRVIRVCSANGNYDIADKAFQNIAQSTTYNQGQTIDMFAVAPYVGNGLNGAASDITTQFRTATDNIYTNRVLTAETIANKYGYDLGTYEGGQHLINNSDVWSRNSAIYNEYIYMLNRWKTKIKLFVHYTHLGLWSSGGSWGAKETCSQSLSLAHKYRALVDWKNANPAREDAEEFSDAALEVAGDQLVSVYPNPSENGSITVEVNDFGPVNVLIINHLGQQVFSGYTDSGRCQITGLPSGLYIVKAAGKSIKSVIK